MTNNEINAHVARIIEAKPSAPPSVFDCENESPGGAWWYDVMQDTGWQPMDFCISWDTAGRCVEWANERGYVIAINVHYGGVSCVGIHRTDRFGKLTGLVMLKANTVPMAICLAFLAAFGGSHDA